METKKRFMVSGLYKSKHLLIVFTGRTGTALLLQPNKSSSAELCAQYFICVKGDIPVVCALVSKILFNAVCKAMVFTIHDRKKWHYHNPLK